MLRNRKGRSEGYISMPDHTSFYPRIQQSRNIMIFYPRIQQSWIATFSKVFLDRLSDIAAVLPVLPVIRMNGCGLFYTLE